MRGLHSVSDAARRARALLFDELHDGPDAAKDALACLVVADDDMERALKLEDELERVDGVEAQPLAEQRHIVADFVGRDRHLETSDSRRFDVAFERFPLP